MLYVVRRMTLGVGIGVIPTSFALSPDGSTFFYRDTVNSVRKVVFPASDVAFANLAFPGGAMSGNNFGNAKIINGYYCVTAQVAAAVPFIKQVRLSDGTVFSAGSATTVFNHSPFVAARQAVSTWTARCLTYGATATPNGRTRSYAIGKPGLNVIPTNNNSEVIDDTVLQVVNQIQFFCGTDDFILWTNGWPLHVLHLNDVQVSNVGVGVYPWARIQPGAADGSVTVSNFLQGLLSDRGGAIAANLRYHRGNHHPIVWKQGPDAFLYGFTYDSVDGKIYYFRLSNALVTPYTGMTFIDSGVLHGGVLPTHSYDSAFALHAPSQNIYFAIGDNVHTLRKSKYWPFAISQSLDLRPAGGGADQISFIFVYPPHVYCVLTTDNVATPNEIVQLYDTDLETRRHGRRGGELFSIVPEVGRYQP